MASEQPEQENPFSKYNYLQWIPPDFDPMDNCVVKAGLSGLAGGAMGIVFGVLFSNTDGSIYGGGITGLTDTKMNYKDYFKSLGKNTWWYTRSFAGIGFLIAGSECFIEKARGKTDSWNGICAGCVTGSLLAVKLGPRFMPGGCMGFAAFSAAIDYFTGHREY